MTAFANLFLLVILISFCEYIRLKFEVASPSRYLMLPAGALLQAEAGGKSRITMRVDNDVLATFKARAEMIGGNYQTLMNDALKCPDICDILTST